MLVFLNGFLNHVCSKLLIKVSNYVNIGETKANLEWEETVKCKLPMRKLKFCIFLNFEFQ